jgi:hypothetical protein
VKKSPGFSSSDILIGLRITLVKIKNGNKMMCSFSSDFGFDRTKELYIYLQRCSLNDEKRNFNLFECLVSIVLPLTIFVSVFVYGSN